MEDLGALVIMGKGGPVGEGSEMRPSEAREGWSLQTALERYLEETEEESGVGCRLTMDILEQELRGGQKRALHDLIREGVSNALRHAGAFRIEVSLRVLGGQVVTKVEDDGRGISQEEIEDPRSEGLIGMREILEQLGGELEIRGIPGDGTALVMRLPLSSVPPGNANADGGDDSLTGDAPPVREGPLG